MEVYSFADELLGCFVGWTSYAETRKVWDAGAPAAGGLLEGDSVVHVFYKFTGFGWRDETSNGKNNRRSFDSASRDETARGSAQDDSSCCALLVQREQNNGNGGRGGGGVFIPPIAERLRWRAPDLRSGFC